MTPEVSDLDITEISLLILPAEAIVFLYCWYWCIPGWSCSLLRVLVLDVLGRSSWPVGFVELYVVEERGGSWRDTVLARLVCGECTTVGVGFDFGRIFISKRFHDQTAMVIGDKLLYPLAINLDIRNKLQRLS